VLPAIDCVVAQVIIRPGLQAIVDFTNPTRTNVSEVVVSGPGVPPIASVDDLLEMTNAGLIPIGTGPERRNAFGSALVGFGVQFQAERSHDLQDRVEARAAFAGERFVKALAGEPGITRDLCHALRPSDVAKGLGNECGIAVSFSKAGFKVGSHFLRGPEVLGDVIASGYCLPHGGYSDRLRARRRAALMSLAWVLLSPPANSSTSSFPRFLKYTR
jgi:hypothetical protein